MRTRSSMASAVRLLLGLALIAAPPVDAPTITISHSVVDGNLAEHPGGRIQIGIGDDSEAGATPAVLTIDATSVSNDQTTDSFDNDGAGIYVETGDLVVVNGSVIQMNTAGPAFSSAFGGGIHHIDNDSLTTAPATIVAYATISGKSAGSRGGGLSVVHAGTFSVGGSTVAGNTSSSSSGGGLAVSGADVSVFASTFSGNAASTGGGIALLEFAGFPEGSITLEKSTLESNTASFASRGGGGLRVNVGDAGADAIVRSSTVTGNSSANFGGGVMVMQTSRLAREHATVVGNAGANGANVFVAAGDIDVFASAIALPLGGGTN